MHGGRLAVPTSSEDFQDSLAAMSKQIYLMGGHVVDKERELVSVHDGQPLTFTNWREPEPNNFNGKDENCLMVYSDGKWNDVACDRAFAPICEF